MITPEVRQFINENADRSYQYPTLPNELLHAEDWKVSKWVCEHSDIPWLEITDFNPPYKIMLEEAQKLKDRFVEHREGEQHWGWASLCLHGLSATQTNASFNYGYQDSDSAPYVWTEIKDLCPVTLEFFKDQFGYDSYQRLRFMLLRPSGYINPHSDNKVSRPLAAINISLNNPDNCQLVSTKGRIPFRREGSIFMFNNHYTHVASNDSTEDRFHIIVHGRTSKIWQKYIANAYKKAIGFL